ncbi:MAG: signal recognition particle-docking protein FtsY [Veillonella sp.]|nr:signal recognition particle-docking protein FtsY [Veillonella sp.]
MAFGFFNRIKEGLAKTRKSFVSNVERVIIGYAQIDDDFLDDLEMVMLGGDLGVKTTEYLMKEIRRGVTEGIINNTGDVMPFLEKRIEELLGDQEETLEMHSPEVILVVGVNGVGKTTTIAKLAHYYKDEGKKVVLAAADTFRAAASEQLTIWAERADVPIVKHKEGADPAAVVFDALASAKARNADIVIIDTAGRLHTKTNLMEELKKIGRVADKQVPGAPHQTLLVLDGTTGQNAVSQAKLFGQAVPVTGIVVTKLDGTAKGGVVISIKEELGVPVRWIGVGEKMDDLRPFNAKDFANALFAKDIEKRNEEQ